MALQGHFLSLNNQMIRDIFVNGTSIASGYGQGHERVAQPNEYSWVNHFCNHFHAQNLWNHSMVSKPMYLSIDHTVGFCEQYFERYGSYNNLFAVIELTLPQAIRFKSVTSKTSEYDSQTIHPVVVHRNHNNDVKHAAQDFSTIFVRHDKDIDYLSTKPIFQYVPPADISEIEYNAHTSRALNYYLNEGGKLAARLYDVSRELDTFQKWMIERNISYVICWGGGKGEKYHKMVDKMISPVNFQNRIIPMQQYTCFSKANEWSINAFNDHPDAVGAKRIADFIAKYVTDHGLLTPPLTKIDTK